MVNLRAYFDVIHEIRGNGVDITQIEIRIQWEDAVAIKEDSDLIVRVSFKLKEESIIISQKLSVSKVVHEGGSYHLDLEGEYVAIGAFTQEDITEVTADVYYIRPD